MLKKIILLVISFFFIFSGYSYADYSIKNEKEIILNAIVSLLNNNSKSKNKLSSSDISIILDLIKKVKKLDNKVSHKKNTSPYYNFSYVFKIGISDTDTNGEVSEIQKNLKKDGFLNDIVDGKFGRNTAKAIEKMKNSFGIYDKKYGEFNPASLSNPEKNTKKYNPKKITEFLGSDQIEFYSINFPFSKNKIKSISCSDRGSIKYIFKDEKIIFPISFPYHLKTNKISCFLETTFSNKKFNFLDIIKKEVKRKVIKVTLNKSATKKYIAPKKSDIDRVAAEKKMLSELFKNADRNFYINTPFSKPVNSIITSPFGVTRIFNGTRKSYHSGTDFRAYTGTPLKSINNGTVILSKNLFYCGNAVIINHGSGIFSTYCHLSRPKVHKGQVVKTGDIIGISGSTGRVSAAHLHLSIKYDNNGTFQYIDFMDMLNRSEVLEK